MSRYIASPIRRDVIIRAGNACEYCLLQDSLSFIPHQIDHIISIKHGGGNELDNLAYACFSCNNNKGSDIGTILLPSRKFIRLFNPRVDNWSDHFKESEGVFIPRTDIGEATIKVLDLNNVDKIIERNA